MRALSLLGSSIGTGTQRLSEQEHRLSGGKSEQSRRFSGSEKGSDWRMHSDGSGRRYGWISNDD